MADGLRWRACGEFQFSEKMDGVWSVREYHGATIVGEEMRDGSFWAFDVVRIGGDSLLKSPLRDRWGALRAFARYGLQLVRTGSGGEFLEAVLANGGEGVVARPWDSTWHHYAWTKCKRSETHDCLVTEKHPAKMSIRLSQNGEDRGWCPALYATFDKVKVGDMVEIGIYGLTAKGKFREPRLLRVRHDLTARV